MKKVMKAVAALMLMMAVFIAAGCSKPDEPNNGGDNNGGNGGGGNINHEYVDLGLPSGTLWATCNVGATTPEGYGDYFAWGETDPKATYNWSTYKYCKNGDGGQLTKYCYDSNCGYDGYTDTLTTLQPEDDAATANWGNEWRMPTYEEFEELLQNTTITWKIQNGVNGVLFTALNGNSVFFPAAGSYLNGQLYVGDGDNVSYWTSSHNYYYYHDHPNPEIGPGQAYSFGNDGGFNLFYDAVRCFGSPVRPVRSTK